MERGWRTGGNKGGAARERGRKQRREGEWEGTREGTREGQRNLVLVAKSVENEEHLGTSEGMLLEQMGVKRMRQKRPRNRPSKEQKRPTDTRIHKRRNAARAQVSKET